MQYLLCRQGKTLQRRVAATAGGDCHLAHLGMEMIGVLGRNGYGKSPFQWVNQLFLWAIFYMLVYQRVELLSVTEYITSLTVDFPEMAMGERETERERYIYTHNVGQDEYGSRTQSGSGINQDGCVHRQTCNLTNKNEMFTSQKGF